MGRKVIKYNFEFGEFVNVKAKYTRGRSGRARHWMKQPIDTIRCLVVGVRTLKNGYANHDDSKRYKIDTYKSFQCAVVVAGMHTKPFNVPLDCVG